ncbi:MAG: chorismate mutase [Eggerthellaceae bacterium]|nr:chorismate mutase [Eggerthellaceae bacterium]
MNKDESMDAIIKHREAIDALDAQIVDLLNKRTEHALEIRALKPAAGMPLYDAKREEEILEAIEACNKGPLYPDNLREIFELILKVSKEVPA